MNSTKDTTARPSLPRSPLALISYQPGKGLMVSTRATFPETAADKIICAMSAIQAVVAAHDAGALQKENYDIHWPLRFAVELLERASCQLAEQAFAWLPIPGQGPP